jgi:hypothetical protein
VVRPRLAGHGPTLFAGLSKRVDLRLVSRLEFGSGAVAMRYEPRKKPLAESAASWSQLARPSKVSTNLIIASVSGDSSRAGLA